MRAIRGIWLARATGFLIGVALAAAVLAGERPAEGGSAVGAEISMYADLNGELAVSPAGPASFLRAPALRPGEPAGGELRIRNQTGQSQEVRVSALGSSPALDDALELTLSAAGRRLRSGSLGKLGAAGGGALVLAPGEDAAIAAVASIRAEPPPSWEAALVDVALLFDLRDAAGATAREGGGR